MTLITDQYRDLNRELHQRNPGYGTSGRRWVPAIDRLARDLPAATMLDYGCGKGTLKAILDGNVPYSIAEYDPAIDGKDGEPAPADLIVCGDVLEHVEPDCLDAVIDHLERLALKAVFLLVATEPAHKTLADGRNAHLIIEPADWWLNHLIPRWRLLDFRDHGPAFQCTLLVR